jgi:hypothetical protein
VLSGTVLPDFKPHHRHQEFLAFVRGFNPGKTRKTYLTNQRDRTLVHRRPG